MWLKTEVQTNCLSKTKRFEELRTKRSDGSMPLSRSAVLKASSCLCWPVLERFTSTCCQATNRVRAIAIGYHRIWPHDEAYQAFSAEYLAGWYPSNRLRLGICRCIANLSSGVLQQWVAKCRVCCSLARNIRQWYRIVRWRRAPDLGFAPSSRCVRRLQN